MSSQRQEMKRLEQPPFAPGKPFVIEALGGENIYLPSQQAIMRHLVTGKDTDNAFACVGSGGIPSDPVPFHYHARMRHDFLCVKGQVKVWLNKECRVLNPGDYASVAPHTVHAYQFVGDYTEIFGIIVPGGWEQFFRFLGTPYDGPMWPDEDYSSPMETVIPKMKVAVDEYDVHPMPDHPAAEVQPWAERDTVLPNHNGPYFMRNGKGPSAVLGGTVIRPIITGSQSDGLFTLGSLEGSNRHEMQVLARGLRFSKVHHCIMVQDGWVEIVVDEAKTSRLGPFETIYLPARTKFQMRVDSRYAKIFIYSNVGGVVDMLYEVGKSNPHKAPHCMIPEASTPFDFEELQRVSSAFDVEVY